MRALLAALAVLLSATLCAVACKDAPPADPAPTVSAASGSEPYVPSTEDPLAPVAALLGGVETLVGAALRDAPNRTALGAVRPGRRWEAHLGDLRAALEAAGVADVALFGFEYELIVRGAGADGSDFYLRGSVLAQGGQARLLGMRGESRARVSVSGLPLFGLFGELAPLERATHALLDLAATADGCARLPLADPAPFGGLPAELRADLESLLETTRAWQRSECTTLAALERERVVVRLDDVSLLALDAKGRPVGLIRADLEMGAGILELDGASLKPFGD